MDRASAIGVPLVGKKPLRKLVVGDFDKLYRALAEQGMQRRRH